MRRLTDYGPSVLVLITALVVLLAGPLAVKEITFARDSANVIRASERLEDSSNILSQINQATRDIATRVEPSVVHISAEQRSLDRFGQVLRSLSSGSGWIYDANGHIVTNFHVVQDADRIEVQLYDGELREAELVGADPSTDIAVIRIAGHRIHPAAIADPLEMVSQGDLVFAFGSPFNFRFSMSSGVVSGLGRSGVGVIASQRGAPSYENFIQVDAAINPGNSGGPLTDHRGLVIGMNTAIATGGKTVGEEGAFAGIGLAIPISMIEPVVSQLIETGTVQKGFLGISAVDYEQPLAMELATLGFRGSGVVVGHMVPGHPARRAGLAPGDVVTHVNGQPVNSTEALQTLQDTLRDDEEVSVRYWHYDVRHDDTFMESTELPVMDLDADSGITLLNVFDTVGRMLESFGFNGRGVRIIRCQPGQPAAEAGLQRYDVITHINNAEIATMRQLQSVISSIRPGDVTTVTAWRYDPDTGVHETIEMEVPLARLNTLTVSGNSPRTRIRTAFPNWDWHASTPARRQPRRNTAPKP
jgi:S1-C subfamily serine protease